MNIRAVCEGHFTLPLPVTSAVPLFTPEGERRWAGSSWDPVYAILDSASDDSAPGTVFMTECDGGAATWIVLERRDDGMSYEWRREILAGLASERGSGARSR